ncbi:G2/M phase-specific E3 ubiquitin-protein ligase-like, partial [Phasianus colchicus]|uniref:G2/M phase-specific E3 ubiquitin-protein ligase-like n=1 Tax=Phasianus colchicus TaxID=9054 RepID=UPI00129DBCF5
MGRAPRLLKTGIHQAAGLHPSCRSFCWQHRPTQQVKPLRQQHPQCAICLEAVEGRPSYNTLICPSCTSAQFHHHCIQGQALRAALHHFRCPLCQDMQAFQAEMFRLGIKIPDRSAPTALPPHGPPPYDLPLHCTNL